MTYVNKRSALRSKVFVPYQNLMHMLAEEDHHKRMYYLELQNEMLEKHKEKQVDRLDVIEKNQRICDHFHEEKQIEHLEKQHNVDLKKIRQLEMKLFLDKQVDYKNNVKQQHRNEHVAFKEKYDRESDNIFNGRGDNHAMGLVISPPMNKISTGVVRAHTEDKKSNNDIFSMHSNDIKSSDYSQGSQTPYYPRYTRRNNVNIDQTPHKPPLYNINENPTNSRQSKNRIEAYNDLMNQQIEKNDEIQRLIIREDALMNQKREKSHERNHSIDNHSISIQNTPNDCRLSHKNDNLSSDQIFYMNEQTISPNTNLRKMIKEKRNNFQVQNCMYNDVVRPISIEDAKLTQEVSRGNRRLLTTHAKSIIQGGGHVNRQLIDQHTMDPKDLYNKIRHTYNKPSTYNIISGT